jgi:hypothetical protein
MGAPRKFMESRAIMIIPGAILAIHDGVREDRAAVLHRALPARRRRGGFFPGIIVYLSHWFRYEDRAKALCVVHGGDSGLEPVGSPISGLLLGVPGSISQAGAGCLIVEGIPAVILGFITIFYLTDWPREASGCPRTRSSGSSASSRRRSGSARPCNRSRCGRRCVIRDVLAGRRVLLRDRRLLRLNIWLPDDSQGGVGLERSEGDDGRR